MWKSAILPEVVSFRKILWVVLYEAEDLPNMKTNIVMPNELAQSICSRDETGQEKYEEYVRERISTDKS